jgi:hypothetical protein
MRSFDGDVDETLAQMHYYLSINPGAYTERLQIYNGLNPKAIVEFGAGYGGMVKAFCQNGFNGIYRIIDLPEMEKLQRKWLKREKVDCNVQWASSPEGNEDLFIAHFSLSEVPYEGRDEILKKCRKIKTVDIAYPYDFPENEHIGGENYDNKTYFAEAFDKFFPNHTFSITPWHYRVAGQTIRRAIGVL